MEDEALFDKINALAHEEHELFDQESSGAASSEVRTRLRQIEVTLDQCWDLLRQRQARRAAGLDPEGAQVRDANVVEGYKG